MLVGHLHVSTERTTEIRYMFQLLSPQAVYQKAYAVGWKQPQPCVHCDYQRVAGIQQYFGGPAAQR